MYFGQSGGPIEQIDDIDSILGGKAAAPDSTAQEAKLPASVQAVHVSENLLNSVNSIFFSLQFSIDDEDSGLVVKTPTSNSKQKADSEQVAAPKFRINPPPSKIDATSDPLALLATEGNSSGVDLLELSTSNLAPPPPPPIITPSDKAPASIDIDDFFNGILPAPPSSHIQSTSNAGTATTMSDADFEAFLSGINSTK